VHNIQQSFYSGLNALSDALTSDVSFGRSSVGVQKERADAAFQAGIKAYNGRDYPVARLLLEESLAACDRTQGLTAFASLHYYLAAVAVPEDRYAAVRRHAIQGLQAPSASDGEVWKAHCLILLALGCRVQGLTDMALQHGQEALEIGRGLGDKALVSHLLRELSATYSYRGEYDQSWALEKESLTLSEAANDKDGLAWSMIGLGSIAVTREAKENARVYLKESLRLMREMDNKLGTAVAVGHLGRLARFDGDYENTASLYHLALSIGRHATNKLGKAGFLELCADAATVRDHGVKAARLTAAAAQVREDVEAPVAYSNALAYEEMVERIVGLLGPDRFLLECRIGRVMTLDQAIEYALESAT
jgi:tetratricopeptide (TPR) repeat protein